MPGRHHELTIEGVVIPLAWDESGRVAGIALNTIDEQEVRIEVTPHGLGRQLFQHLRQWARLTGTTTDDGLFRVRRFAVREHRTQ